MLLYDKPPDTNHKCKREMFARIVQYTVQHRLSEQSSLCPALLF